MHDQPEGIRFAEQSELPANRHRPKRAIAFAIATALVVGLAVGGYAIARSDETSEETGADSAAAVAPFGTMPGSAPALTPSQQRTIPGGTNSAATSQSAATDSEQTGIATIDTVINYGSGQGAGTGIVLTSDGLVLTNHHVVESATEITVTVESTGQAYTATLVGSDGDTDVAVLQLADASGLQAATIDDDNVLAVGDAVTAVGNSQGGGELMAAAGTVTALAASITASSGQGTTAETLSDLIEFDADVVSGDSGGALLDAEGEVVGMTTAASTGPDVTGYAIDIDDALAIVEQIAGGDESGGVTLGYPAFLGVQVDATASTGAMIAGVIDGTPAAEAGLAAGDTITSVDGAAITSSADLSAALAARDPGDKVTLIWTTADGTTRQATVTLTEGPVA